MSDFNQIILIGHLCFKPDLSYTPKGTAYAKTRIAANYTAVKADGSKFDDTLFIDLVAWAKLAETISTYLDKGSRVMIQGRLRLEKWQTKDGQARSKHLIQISKCIFLSKSNEAKIDAIDEARNDPGQEPKPPEGTPPISDSQDEPPIGEEIPF